MNNNTKLRWGILGAARINQQLMPAIVEAENSELIAIASRRPGAAAETLKKYAPQLKEVKIYDQAESILTDSDIQAVYIPLANKEHAQWTIRAIEHGKHVLCEKPMALTVNDIETINTAAEKNNVIVMEGFMYRFHPQHTRVKEIIASGLIGEVRSVRSCFAYPMQPARHYRIDDSVENGSGAMWDIGCYAIHAARLPFYNESPLVVSAMAKHIDSGADISCNGIIDFGDGKYAHFDFGFEHARRAEYEVIGTKGGLKCHNVWAKQAETPVISWWTDSGQQCQETLALANHFRLEVEHFSHCVLNKIKPVLSLEDAKTNCQVITAALQSVKTGKQVKIY
ncbi:MAG: Gfo/Idh/MocA family oxidoreductase [Methylococcaceae bacterium]|nr:Gfo/Idh/MocA family oxidoreductase [Methylococcaceae bacterium]